MTKPPAPPDPLNPEGMTWHEWLAAASKPLLHEDGTSTFLFKYAPWIPLPLWMPNADDLKALHKIRDAFLTGDDPTDYR